MAPRNTNPNTLPFILRSEKYFNLINIEGINITATCVTCSKTVRGSTVSNTNFRKHFRVHHKDGLDNYESELKEDKRRKVSTRQEDQPAIGGFVTVNQEKSVSRTDKLFINFVVKGIHSLRTIEEPGFRDLVNGLNSSVKIPSRTTLVRRIDQRFLEVKEYLKKELKRKEYVCLTADAWTCDGKRRAFLGVTCHWITPNYERKSFALACRRFTSPHSYDRIAQLLNEIRREYNLRVEQIIKVITDNGSNFVKAFREYQGDQDELLQENEDDETIEAPDFITLSDIIGGRETENEDDTEEAIVLPPHERCASHTLSLICVKDISDSKSKLMKSSFAKCYGIWNKSSRSTGCAEKIKDICGTYFTKPCDTRWNSLYDSLSSLLKKKDTLNKVCSELNVPTLQEHELEFIQQYCNCVQPVADALDRLQGENHTFYGELIPTLLTVKKKLQTISAQKPKHCEWLPKALLQGLQKRFESYLSLSLAQKDAIIAAISHLKMKLRWIPASKVQEMRELFIDVAVQVGKLSSPTNKIDNDEPPSDNFLIFENAEVSARSICSDETLELTIRQECVHYFGDNLTEFIMLNKYPTIQQIFMNYNTTLPSSAPVERLFSYGSLVLSPKRKLLSDKNFEQLLLLKVNEY